METHIADQFKGLPMADLIGGPLNAACDAQVKLAKATEAFIHSVSFHTDPTGQAPPSMTVEYVFEPGGPVHRQLVSLPELTSSQLLESLARSASESGRPAG
jgi:hypothetical protein